MHFNGNGHHWVNIDLVKLAWVLSAKRRPNELKYRQTSNTSGTLIGIEVVDHSDVVRASPVGAAPTTSSLST